MSNPVQDDGVRRLVETDDDAVVTSVGRAVALEISGELLGHPGRILRQHGGHEFDDCRRYAGRKPGKISVTTAGGSDPPALVTIAVQGHAGGRP
jgi:hypothetical protein